MCERATLTCAANLYTMCNRGPTNNALFCRHSVYYTATTRMPRARGYSQGKKSAQNKASNEVKRSKHVCTTPDELDDEAASDAELLKTLRSRRRRHLLPHLLPSRAECSQPTCRPSAWRRAAPRSARPTIRSELTPLLVFSS